MKKLSPKQVEDIECVSWFIPNSMRHIEITDEDKQLFIENSEKGMHKDKINGLRVFNDNTSYLGFNALLEGKKWRGIHALEMYEQGVLEGTVPYMTLLEGMPRVVVNFLKKEMFKGADSEIIEKCYQSYETQ